MVLCDEFPHLVQQDRAGWACESEWRWKTLVKKRQLGRWVCGPWSHSVVLMITSFPVSWRAGGENRQHSAVVGLSAHFRELNPKHGSVYHLERWSPWQNEETCKAIWSSLRITVETQACSHGSQGPRTSALCRRESRQLVLRCRGLVLHFCGYVEIWWEGDKGLSCQSKQSRLPKDVTVTLSYLLHF